MINEVSHHVVKNYMMLEHYKMCLFVPDDDDDEEDKYPKQVITSIY